MPSQPINIGTINTDKKMSWAPRAKPFAAVIDSMALDLINFQEAMEFENDFLRLFTPAKPNDWGIGSDHVNCPTMYRTDRFERAMINGKNSINIDMRTVPFVRKRYGSAAALKDKTNGQTFILVDIHLSNGTERGTSAAQKANSARDRILQAKDCWAALESWGVTGYPILLFGDLNDRLFSPDGPAGVFVGHGMTDALRQLGAGARIDRGFMKGFKATAIKVFPMSNSLSDHDPVRYTVEWLGQSPTPPPDTTPETTLQRLNREHGKITKFKIASFEKARIAGSESRYTAVVQDWLGLPIDCTWSKADQSVLDGWRHKKFPSWPKEDYEGPVGITSMTALSAQAKQQGKRTYPVVEK